MKKKFFTTLALALGLGTAIAAPVDVQTAQSYGQKFVQNTLGYKNADVELAYTKLDAKGEACVYVFNFSNGFVVISADDVAQPLLGYSDEGAFDQNNIPEGLAYYLGHYASQISFAVENGIQADEEVMEAWKDITDGVMASKNEHDVGPLIDLRWNQDYPYNYFCPNHNYGPGGHVYVGCVADAMAMVMKYWNWPDHGAGTHTYTPQGFPQQTGDFENTYYDWNNMPISISYGSQSQYIQAIARLMWHCGISVDMQYGYDGSGAYSFNVPNAISTYFRYTPSCEYRERDLFTKTQWEDMLIASFDEGFPCYYSGQDTDGGHAFVCDGYNPQRQMHFNWGWSGSGNGFFTIDALNVTGYHFNLNQGAVFDFVPDYIFETLVPAVEDITISAENANSKNAVVSWTTPSVSVTGAELGTIDQVVLLRNGNQIYTANNVNPGEVISFNDQVPSFDCYTYSVYYVSNGTKGRISQQRFQYGPTCTWKLIGQTTNFQGWNNGVLQVLNSFGTVVDELTLTSSTPISKQVATPEGTIKLKWVAPSATVQNLTINVKNSSNTSVYNYTGSSTGLSAGYVFTGDNDCAGCLPPENFYGEYQWSNGFGTLLSWDYDETPQSFKVYRSTDGTHYECIATVDKDLRQYFDEAPLGTYYYKVTAFRSYCESTPAWTAEGNTDYVMIQVTELCEDASKVAVYPNPSNESITIAAEDIREITISNLLGQIVYNSRCEGNQVNVVTADFNDGIYNVTVKTNTSVMTTRFSVVH